MPYGRSVELVGACILHEEQNKAIQHGAKCGINIPCVIQTVTELISSCVQETISKTEFRDVAVIVARCVFEMPVSSHGCVKKYRACIGRQQNYQETDVPLSHIGELTVMLSNAPLEEAHVRHANHHRHQASEP